MYRLASKQLDQQYFSSGLPGLDAAIGDVRGVPGRTILQLVADPKCGKTTLAFSYIKEAQARGIQEIQIQDPTNKKNMLTINAAFLDLERSFDAYYAASLGVDLDKLLIIEPPFSEDGFQIVLDLLALGLQLIVVDSVAAIVSRSEEDKPLTDNEKMASSASLQTRAIKRINLLSANKNALVILINQYRANISTMSRVEKKMSGARALEYFSKVIISLARVSNSDESSDVELFVQKTKYGAERRKTRATLEYGLGFNEEAHIIELATESDIIEKGGAWYYYPSKENAEYKANGMKQATSMFPIDIIKEQLLTRMLTKQEQERNVLNVN